MAKYSKCTVRNKAFLEKLSKYSKCRKPQTDLKKLVNSATPDQLNSITEIAINTLRGNIPHSQANRNRLKVYKQIIRSLAKQSLSAKKRKTLLVQKGGFLGTFLAPILAALAGDIISKYV